MTMSQFVSWPWPWPSCFLYLVPLSPGTVLGQRGYNYSDSAEDANEAQRVKKSVLACTARIRKPGSGNFPTLALASTL